MLAGDFIHCNHPFGSLASPIVCVAEGMLDGYTKTMHR